MAQAAGSSGVGAAAAAAGEGARTAAAGEGAAAGAWRPVAGRVALAGGTFQRQRDEARRLAPRPSGPAGGA